MSIKCVEIPVQTAATGGGTVTSPLPLTGEIIEIAVPLGGTAITLNGGSTDWTFTRRRDGGTVAQFLNTDAPFWKPIRAQAIASGLGGGSAFKGPDLSGVPESGIPINDHLVVTIAEGQFSKAGTVFVHLRC